MPITDRYSPHQIRQFKYRLLVLICLSLLTALIFPRVIKAEDPATTTMAFKAVLSGANQVPDPVMTNASGMATLVITGNMSRTLYYQVNVSDIDNITAAHIHRGGASENGPPIFWLYDRSGANGPGGAFDPDNPIMGSLALTDQDWADLLKGNFYINVHTTTYGAGEIRGQIMPQPLPTSFNTILSGANEVSTRVVDTPASGVGLFTFDPDTNALQYDIGVTEIISITAAHIHRGGPAQNGPPVFWLYDQSGANGPGGSFGPGEPISGTLTLSAADVVDLVSGRFYVNVHTAATPLGEIRGQVGAATGALQAFATNLSGAHGPDPINTQAFGHAGLALSADMQTLYYRVMVADINDITVAHIHQAKPDANGPPIFWLYDQSGVNGPDGDFGPTAPIAGELTLSTAQLAELLAGNYYINVHTTAYSGGEIRGQISAYTPPSAFSALLTGANNVPDPVETGGVGVTRFSLNQDLNKLTYTFAVTNITTTIQAAHIHTGWPDSNGPPVFTFPIGAGSLNLPGGSFDLNAENLRDLLSGYYYVNIHTVNYGSGEVRGQIYGASLYKATLSGTNHVPDPVETSATGEAILALSADANSLYYRLRISDLISPTMAHIHRGGVAENGPVVAWLYDANGANGPGGPLDAANPVSGVYTMTANDLFDLLAGNLYVNVHTTANPSGEIRGQLMPYSPPSEFSSTLSGENETTPVTTLAGGDGQLDLISGLNRLHYNLAVTNIVSITMAHFHKAPAGVDGPVVFWLYDQNGVNGPGGRFDPSHPLGDAVRLEAENLVDLLTGYYYINVHTVAHGSGEIRGQILGLAQLYLPLIAK